MSQAQDLGPRMNESRRAPRYDLKREDGPQLPRHFLPDGFFGIGKSRSRRLSRRSQKCPCLIYRARKKPDGERSSLGQTGGKVGKSPSFAYLRAHRSPITRPTRIGRASPAPPSTLSYNPIILSSLRLNSAPLRSSNQHPHERKVKWS